MDPNGVHQCDICHTNWNWDSATFTDCKHCVLICYRCHNELDIEHCKNCDALHCLECSDGKCVFCKTPL